MHSALASCAAGNCLGQGEHQCTECLLPGRLACGQRHSLHAEPRIWSELYGSLHDVHLPHCLSQLSLLAYISLLQSTVILIKTTITFPWSIYNQSFIALNIIKNAIYCFRRSSAQPVSFSPTSGITSCTS